jgi:hypothetical protein
MRQTKGIHGDRFLSVTVFNKNIVTDFASVPNSVNTAGRYLTLTTIKEAILNLKFQLPYVQPW